MAKNTVDILNILSYKWHSKSALVPELTGEKNLCDTFYGYLLNDKLQALFTQKVNRNFDLTSTYTER